MVTTQTVRHSSKAFSWSWSKLSAYETCPHQYYRMSVKKDVKGEETEALKEGNAVHEALAKVVEGHELPSKYRHLEVWVDRLRLRPEQQAPSELYLAECKMAIREDFSLCGYFDKDVWYRGVADLIKIVGRVALVVDYKTGKIKEDGTQLALMAQCVFSKYPDIERIRSEFVWLKEDATTRADFTRDDMPKIWAKLLPRVDRLKVAHETNTFPPKQGGLCNKWCLVKDCAFNGR